jgi:hypothetical protein
VNQVPTSAPSSLSVLTSVRQVTLDFWGKGGQANQWVNPKSCSLTRKTFFCDSRAQGSFVVVSKS